MTDPDELPDMTDPDELPDMTDPDELPETPISPRAIQRWLRAQGLNIEELRARDNHPGKVAARLIVARYLHRRGWSSVMIGRYLGRHHTTILHHLQKGA